jgi:four helix bundle protein
MNDTQADLIEDRLIDFAAQIIVLSGDLPPTYAGRHISQQMLRSGTSPAPNYGEARGAESRSDFVHKLGIALKEMNETKIWLKMIIRAKLLAKESVAKVLEECQQLSRLLNSSVQTARRNAGK